MVSRDKFESFETAIGAKNLFSHLATFALTFAISLGVEKAVDHYYEPTKATFGILIICASAACFGLLFLALSYLRNRKVAKVKENIFADENLISDQVFTHTDKGTMPSYPH